MYIYILLLYCLKDPLYFYFIDYPQKIYILKFKSEVINQPVLNETRNFNSLPTYSFFIMHGSVWYFIFSFCETNILLSFYYFYNQHLMFLNFSLIPLYCKVDFFWRQSSMNFKTCIDFCNYQPSQDAECLHYPQNSLVLTFYNQTLPLPPAPGQQ